MDLFASEKATCYNLFINLVSTQSICVKQRRSMHLRWWPSELDGETSQDKMTRTPEQVRQGNSRNIELPFLVLACDPITQ